MYPEIRLYLEPGTIEKTSSGKIKHGFNRKNFHKESFTGLIKRVSSVDEKKVHENTNHIVSLFHQIVGFEPKIESTLFSSGGDSVKIIEFIHQVEEKYKIELSSIDEKTSIQDIILATNNAKL